MPSPDQLAGQDLADIKHELGVLLESATSILRNLDNQDARHSAHAYWVAHIQQALGGFGYSTHATTLDDTIAELSGNCCGDCGEPVEDEDDELCEDCK